MKHHHQTEHLPQTCHNQLTKPHHHRTRL